MVKKNIIQIKDIVYIILKSHRSRRRITVIDACIAVPAECLEGTTNNFEFKENLSNFEKSLRKEVEEFTSNLEFTEIEYKSPIYLVVLIICIILTIFNILWMFFDTQDIKTPAFLAIMNILIAMLVTSIYFTQKNFRTFKFGEKGMTISDNQKIEIDGEYVEDDRYISWSEIKEILINKKEIEIKYELPKKEYDVDYSVKIYKMFLKKEDYNKIKEILEQKANLN